MRKIALVTLLLVMAVTSLGVHAQTDSGDAFVTIDLGAGFVLDPFIISVNGGGEVDAATLDSNCTGFINSAPTVRVNWTGEADYLQALFFSDHDPVLVIQTPDGSYLCGDDVNPLVLDPLVEINNPPQGEYAV